MRGGKDQTLFAVFPVRLLATLVYFCFPKLRGKIADDERAAARHEVGGREELDAVHDAADVGTCRRFSHLGSDLVAVVGNTKGS